MKYLERIPLLAREQWARFIRRIEIALLCTGLFPRRYAQFNAIFDLADEMQDLVTLRLKRVPLDGEQWISPTYGCSVTYSCGWKRNVEGAGALSEQLDIALGNDLGDARFLLEDGSCRGAAFSPIPSALVADYEKFGASIIRRIRAELKKAGAAAR